jgi:hypothetical protein
MPPEESPAAPPLSAKPLPARREAAPVDLLAAAGVPVLKRVIPLAIAAALLIALLIWLL